MIFRNEDVDISNLFAKAMRKYLMPEYCILQTKQQGNSVHREMLDQTYSSFSFHTVSSVFLFRGHGKTETKVFLPFTKFIFYALHSKQRGHVQQIAGSSKHFYPTRYLFNNR